MSRAKILIATICRSVTIRMGGSHAASPTTPSPVGVFSLRKASFEENPATLNPNELENCKAALAVLQERLRVHDGVEHEYSALQVRVC